MHPITKKQKIQYILAAAGFVLLALALLFLLLQGPSGGKSDADAAPTPEVTDALCRGLRLHRLARKSHDALADELQYFGRAFSCRTYAAAHAHSLR